MLPCTALQPPRPLCFSPQRPSLPTNHNPRIPPPPPSHRGGDCEYAAQLLSPLKSILNFAIVLVAGATSLSAYGINVAPLMASVGGLGVVVALATQSLAANFVSALALVSVLCLGGCVVAMVVVVED